MELGDMTLEDSDERLEFHGMTKGSLNQSAIGHDMSFLGVTFSN